MSSHLYLHLLTVPSQRPDILDRLRASVTAPGNLSKPESIKTWLDENREAKAQEALVKTAYDGAAGEIVTIAWAFNDRPACAVSRSLEEPESELISSFFEVLQGDLIAAHPAEAPTFVGHNLLGFDLRFLYQRAVINRLAPPIPLCHDVRYNGDRAFDTMQAWAGWNQKISLVELAGILGLDDNGPLLGPGETQRLAHEGNVDTLSAIAMEELVLKRQVHLCMTFAEEVILA